MAINMTKGNRYTFAAVDGTPVLINSSDHAGETTLFNNNVKIADVNGDGNGILTILGSSNDVSNGPQLHLAQTGLGNTGIHFDQGSGGTHAADWTIGIDSSEGTEFRIMNTTALVAGPEFKLSTAGHLTLEGGLTVTAGGIDMNGVGVLDHVREIQFQDWDSSTLTSHDTSRLLMRDSTLFVYNGGLCVGNYNNNVLGDIGDTQLDVEEKITVGQGNSGTTSAIAQGANEVWLEAHMVSTSTSGYSAASNGQNAGWIRWSSDSNNHALLGLDVEQERFRMLYYDGSDWEGFNTDKSGNMVVSGTYTSSDLRLKENINTVSGALGIVKQMRGVTFDWKKSSDPGKRHSAGVIAQEIEAIENIPEGLVYTDNTVRTYDEDGNPEEGSPTIDNKKSANYSALSAYLIEAIKEQQTMIEDLKARIEVLENA
jgi:hypothetical protein